MTTASDLASVLAGASLGYLDAQNGAPVSVTDPMQGTPYGVAGYGQPVPGNGASAALSTSNPLLLIGILVVGAVLLMRR